MMMEFVNAFEVESIEPEEGLLRVSLRDMRGEKVELRMPKQLEDKVVVGNVVKMYLEF